MIRIESPEDAKAGDLYWVFYGSQVHSKGIIPYRIECITLRLIDGLAAARESRGDIVYRPAWAFISSTRN